MSRLNTGSAAGVFLLMLLHIGISITSRINTLDGVFFTSGSTILSDGKEYSTVVRLQSHDSQMHVYEQINDKGESFSFSVVNFFLGSARFLTGAAITNGDVLENISIRDRDIAFNYAYLSSFGSPLTFYKLNLQTTVLCYFVKELERIWCLGEERNH